MSIFANSGKIGEVGSNLTATFTVEETPIGRTTIDSAGSPTSSRPVGSSDLLRSGHDDGPFVCWSGRHTGQRRHNLC